ncbi:MAG: class I SAM-dependent methyltransferase [Planctomycetota bacterium]
MEEHVANHYTVPELAQSILDAAGELSVDGLAAVDEFHIRGRAATEELAESVNLSAEHKVLDVGCGIGGTSRFLASRYDCDVTGIDLTESYTQVATLLSERVGLPAKFHCGNALDLPFDDASFDVVWTEHAQMNIADKARFYGEIRRVLRPGGQFAFHDIFAGSNPPVAYPVPWAGEESISHLADVDTLDWSGFERVYWEDTTARSVGFFEEVLSSPPRALGLHLLTKKEALGNVLKNLQRGSIRVVQAVMARDSA